MAKKKANPFAKLQGAPPASVPSKTQEPTVEVTTKIRKKTGRPSSFEEATSRLTADIPTTTLKAMQRELPDSAYRSQAQFVNAAILAFLGKGKQEEE